MTTILAILLTISSAFASGTIEHQDEASFVITKEALQRILPTKIFKQKKRNDFYFEIYQEGQFLLQPNPNHYKFRLQAGEKSSILQTTKSTSKISSCPGQNGAQFEVKQKTMGELEVKDSDVKKIASLFSDEFSALDLGDSSALRKTLHQIQKLVEGVQIPFLNEILNLPSAPDWTFTASHSAQKTKWRAKIDYGFGSIDLDLIEAEEVAPGGFAQQKFELEIQPTDTLSDREFENSVCAALEDLGLTQRDFAGHSLDPDLATLDALKNLY